MRNKLSDTLDSNVRDVIIFLKIERDINKELLAMRKKDRISENLYTRSTWGQPAMLYVLAKVHKEHKREIGIFGFTI